MESIRSEVIGEGIVFATPYGPRRLTYTDHAASGRAFKPIELFLCKNVMPSYGNTHTETSYVGAQTTAYREQAREIIRNATGCSAEDAVIFAGNGVTGAVHVLTGCLDLSRKPIVFIGPYEHHSIELPFRTIADVEVVADCDIDGINLDDLAARMRQFRGRPIIGAFSAASNVTGRITNVEAVARVVHDAGGVVFFDYAAAGPYAPIQMNGNGLDRRSELGYADAIFLSMHKFLGGPGAPGVLLAKRHLFERATPHMPGGGTISYVSPNRHTFLSDPEHREEGGTPNIPGSIKAGLAMSLKIAANAGGAGGAGGGGTILEHEMSDARRCIEAWRPIAEITVLGNLDAPRLGTLSFLVHCGGKLLHHNFVVALLNDLFGIQARGGNSCAAPYAHRLLKVGDAAEAEIEKCVGAGWHGCKPGWTRVSFGWYDSDETVEFVIEAVKLIASLGWRFLSDYSFNPKSGTWKHLGFEPEMPVLDINAPIAQDRPVLPESVRPAYLAEALSLASVARPIPVIQPTPFEGIRWFWLPGELR